MYDCIIIGGGIVGLATALALKRHNPQASLAVLEKEDKWASHQTGRNSGVLHSGVYYNPGSLKAKLAVKGRASMVRFCKEYGIEHEVCGKVIVATDEKELPAMEGLYQKGIKNGLELSKLSKEEVFEREPHVNTVGGLFIPDTGIVNYRQVSERIVQLLESQGANLFLGTKALQINETSEEAIIDTNKGDFRAKQLINCAGLYSDEVVKRSGVMTDLQIIPFKGEYYDLVESKKHLVKNLIYPVPDPKYPFLGVHLTRQISGEVHAGPNAVLSLKKEGYQKYELSCREAAAIFSNPGFWRFAVQNIQTGLMEMARSINKDLFVKSLQRLIPEIVEDDVIPGESGIRAQALLKDGRLVDDFFVINGKRSIHVCNAPSPAATASLVIGEMIAGNVQ
ncbi:L-2-hydroxyglutarate oxidase [Lentibacillus halodurans]|uniref:L-2-hydroxyglutarate oxidase n=1 Tax=Lentibacillus halodurans TaxID=237679 RepID=A0A1I0YFQ3_9BACI|nr:L-2-hydroxyglutarate oxidase [Lentibacillus halodurans]SFB12012.1 L-2-hydroxyglutarate oxidase [Lentibacillus halodurans]